MEEFRITFGVQYAYQLHPLFAGAHPFGWLTVWAPDQMKARATAYALLGSAWAFDYSVESMSAEDWGDYHPIGELAAVSSTDLDLSELSEMVFA
jgi:hypothetical protein